MHIAPSFRHLGPSLLALLLTLTACGRENLPKGNHNEHPGADALAGPQSEVAGSEIVVLDPQDTRNAPPPDVAETVAAMARATRELEGEGSGEDPPQVTVDDPADGAVFPPAFVPPTFLWHDADEYADVWIIEVAPQGGDEPPLVVRVPGSPPAPGEIDPTVIADTNELHEPTPYEASAHAWKPTPAVWAAIQRHARGTQGARVTIAGFSKTDPLAPRSRGSITIHTSSDEVGAPIFYRDVPLIPAEGEAGTIVPLAAKALPLIAWRLRDTSLPESRVLLTGMHSCANCHSFSKDGKTLGMDIDGPLGDKGAYGIATVAPHVVIERDDVMTWTSMPGHIEGHKTIGFLSRVSPDGQYVVSTVNESLYVANFKNFRFLQVFFPTRGVLAFWSRRDGTMKTLPGADNAAYVHCDAVFSPDGKTLVFARARAMDPYVEGTPLAAYPNDPNEAQIRYDLYRMPFREGRGGTAERIEGASNNGMSNTFPKVSPDGKWIVFTKCKNGQLMRPDGKLFIVPFPEGGEAREMRCNLGLMNSWHSFSPNGRWLVFSSKARTPYTQMFLTHIDEKGYSSPAILIPNATAANRAVNIPEFVNTAYDAFLEIEIPAANHHTFFQRGHALLKAGRLREALVSLEKAIQAEPEFSRAHADLGVIHDRLGNREKARGHYEKALAIDRSNYFVHTNYGLLLYREGKVKEALEHWQEALDINPTDVMAHTNVGMAMAREGRSEEAARQFRLALKTDPAFTAAHKNLAVLAREAGDLETALQHVRAALKTEKNDPWLHFQEATLLDDLGRPRLALAAWEALIRVKPDEVGARTRLAWLLATSPDADVRDGKRALAEAKKACAASGYALATALDALAAAYAELGRFDEALAMAEKAQQIARPQDRPLAGRIGTRMRLYRRGQPYHSAAGQ